MMMRVGRPREEGNAKHCDARARWRRERQELVRVHVVADECARGAHSHDGAAPHGWNATGGTESKAHADAYDALSGERPCRARCRPSDRHRPHADTRDRRKRPCPHRGPTGRHVGDDGAIVCDAADGAHPHVTAGRVRPERPDAPARQQHARDTPQSSARPPSAATLPERHSTHAAGAPKARGATTRAAVELTPLEWGGRRRARCVHVCR